MKIALVYCLHGNEKKTEEIAKHFESQGDVKIFFGNPKAYEEGVRFTESDMNRSFNRTDTYEGKEAARLKAELDEYNADLVIDLHMTKATMPPTIIVTDLKRLELAKLFGVNKVIYMTEIFANGGSLIENIKNSITIEILDDEKVIEIGIDIINNVLYGDKLVDEFDVYTVERKVTGKPVGDIKNFEMLENGKYPVFYGNKSYVKNSGVYYLECGKSVFSINN
jgi:hypothetical protein